MSDADDIADRFQTVTDAVETACAAASRAKRQVTLVAVSKTQPIDALQAALATGHRIFGENRIQETAAKWPQLRLDHPDIYLHLIGHIQTNKAADAVALFDLIETVDRPKLAAALAKEMQKQGRSLPCYVQVNVGREPQKGGVDPDEIADFVARCRSDFGLRVRGLMCIPPVGEDPLPHFHWLAAKARALDLPDVSMGMSADYPLAIAAGATHVRVGTALFGSRKTA